MSDLVASKFPDVLIY